MSWYFYFADETLVCVMEVEETRLDQPSHFDLELELLRWGNPHVQCQALTLNIQMGEESPGTEDTSDNAETWRASHPALWTRLKVEVC